MKVKKTNLALGQAITDKKGIEDESAIKHLVVSKPIE